MITTWSFSKVRLLRIRILLSRMIYQVKVLVVSSFTINLGVCLRCYFIISTYSGGNSLYTLFSSFFVSTESLLTNEKNKFNFRAIKYYTLDLFHKSKIQKCHKTRKHMSQPQEALYPTLPFDATKPHQTGLLINKLL